MIPVIVLQGPTAVGKSTAAMEIARHFQTEIISADSRQVYKYLDIGTAKPSPQEQSEIRHHLIDIITPDQTYSAGDFASQAAEIINKLHELKKVPLLAGGTGFYLKALLEGIFQAPTVPGQIRENLKAEAAEKGSEHLHRRLQQVDPDSAVRAAPNDLNRIIRALEIYQYTGKSITRLWSEKPPLSRNFRFFNILLTDERQSLYRRIEKRVDEMIRTGLVQELKSILDMGYSSDSPGLNTVGYKELIPHLLNDLPIAACIGAIKQHSRNYAKRQFTWYGKIHFDLTLFASDINFYAVFREIERFLEAEEEKGK